MTKRRDQRDRWNCLMIGVACGAVAYHVWCTRAGLAGAGTRR